MKNLRVSTSTHRQLTNLADSLGVTAEKAIGMLVGTQLRERPASTGAEKMHAMSDRNKIPAKMHDMVYDTAKGVYINKSLTFEQGITKLRTKMNGGSAAVRINLVKNLLEGRAYKSNTGAQATQYFLKRILDDFGTDRCKKALKALKANIEHLRSLGHPAKRLEAVYKEYTALV